MAGMTRMPLPLMIILMFFLARAHAAAPSSDVLALVELRRGIRGFALESWKMADLDSNGCPVNWHGIQCSGGLVTSINLDNLNLAGEIKLGSLANMKMLANLSLSNNNISGKLDAQLHSLSSLQYFDISKNLFYGRIPGAIVALERLVHLNFSSNKLSGKIPEGFNKLRELRRLDLHSNQLSGPIDNGLVELQNVEYLDFSSNQISGTLPQMLPLDSGLRRSLQYLNLSNNQYSGSLLYYDSIPFENLRVLDISNNHFSGELPSFEFVYSLETLRLGNNSFFGNLPNALFADDSFVIKELDLSRNKLSGPVSTITSKTLNVLNLSSNALSGVLPIKFGSCTVVDLSNNNLSGNLSVMRIWGNYLEMLDLSQNSFTGSLPNDTSQFLRLTYLNLSHNALVGPIPSVLGTYSKISTIDLSFNQLNGPLLMNLFTSPTLAHLHLSRNNFTGSIPLQDIQPISPSASRVPVVTNYSPLESLDLSNNQLSGFIPREVGAINSLRTLNLAGNQFLGSIPSELSKLYALTNLNLCCNQLTGKIPNNLSANLKALNVSYNELSGFVPLSLRKFPDSSFHPGNAHLIYPYAPISSDGGPVINGKHRHEKGLGSDVKAVIIGVCTAGAAVLIALALFLYHRRNSNMQHSSRYVDLGEKIDTRIRDEKREKNTGAEYFEFHKDVDPTPPVSMKFSADNLLASEKGLAVATPKVLATEAAVQETLDVKAKGIDSAKTSAAGVSLSNKKRRSSPGSQSYFSSSPQSDDSFTSEHPVILKVRSPDRLAGDLFFLDNTLSFTAEELSRAPAEVLGRSSHGTSYKATLDNGHVLRVKWLREGLAKHKKEFAREAKKFGNIRHPNLVALRGYYWGQKEHEKLILSDYVSAESLASHIYERSGGKTSPLSWSRRLKIAVDLARGLNYLHYEICLSHGNLKATNILLDGPDLNGKHADYSLHLLMTPAGTAEQILNAGALGYRAPELATAKKPKPSFKADVYAFGVILMEILTGKSAGDIISANSGVVDLTDWVRLLATEGRAVDCFDRILVSGDGDQEPPKGMDDMLAIALKCIQPASERPSIRTVFEDLTAIVV
ncbi:hypothetical protein KI387_038706 [Taxus chinensis]|uniref:Protein kinase domain-containing protein n=1 Tax=Taxus chinensis TaxID=29808 RepID=A0AA38FA91_TAXCH|nr:hypothetical protein KI387_038706 [Taxus chinensis]